MCTRSILYYLMHKEMSILYFRKNIVYMIRDVIAIYESYMHFYIVCCFYDGRTIMKLWADNGIFSPRKSDNYVSSIELASCIHLINIIVHYIVNSLPTSYVYGLDKSVNHMKCCCNYFPKQNVKWNIKLFCSVFIL